MCDIEWEEQLEEVQKRSEHWYKMYSELKAKNVELKKKYVKNICDCDICDTYCNSQLIKAKEIIRELLFHLGNTFIVSYTSKEESITKAEQFLKEV